MKYAIIALTTLFAVTACGRPEFEGDPIVTSITGKVLDSETSDPIPNALITTDPFLRNVTTNAQGQYIIDKGLEEGVTYRVNAEKAGYESNNQLIANIIEGDNTVADILLHPLGPELSVSSDNVLIGSGDDAGQFSISNSGDTSQALSFTASSTNGWVTSVTPSSGDVTTMPINVVVDIDRASLPAGTGDISGSVSVTSNGGTATVTLQVVR